MDNRSAPAQAARQGEEIPQILLICDREAALLGRVEAAPCGYPEAIMRAIRERYLAGTSVTLVLMGACTWARRYVDWEIHASLMNTASDSPNGLPGIKLPTCSAFPERFNANLHAAFEPPAQDCYARWINYPQSGLQLNTAIQEAYDRRTTHAHLINNTTARMFYNKTCA